MLCTLHWETKKRERGGKKRDRTTNRRTGGERERFEVKRTLQWKQKKKGREEGREKKRIG